MPRPTSALIADDEAHVRAYFRTLLNELGVEACWETEQGAEVVALVGAHSPGLVLLDLNLKGLGGMAVLRQLVESHPEVPVVIITTQNSAELVKQAAELGASGYILKHKPRGQVLGSLRELIEALALDDADEAGT